MTPNIFSMIGISSVRYVSNENTGAWVTYLNNALATAAAKPIFTADMSVATPFIIFNTYPEASSNEKMQVLSRAHPGSVIVSISTKFTGIDNGELSALQGELSYAKYLKRAEINAARLSANRTSFTYAGERISCDELSRSDIDGVNGIVSLTGAMPPGWIGFWKSADNVYIPIPDVPTWIAFYAAMVAQGQSNFVHSDALKAAIDLVVDSPTALAEVAAITW